MQGHRILHLPVDTCHAHHTAKALSSPAGQSVFRSRVYSVTEASVPPAL